MIDLPREPACYSDSPEWLEMRSGLVTASEIGPVLGEAPSWLTRDDLIRKKATGVDDFVPYNKTWWGQFHEPHIIDAYSELTGSPVRPVQAFFTHPGGVRVGATIDALCEAPSPRAVVERHPGWVHQQDKRVYTNPYLSTFYSEVEAAVDAGNLQGIGILEIKNTYGWSIKKKWVDDLPAYYWAQVQCQLWLLDLQWGVLCPKVGYCDIVPRLILRDPDFAGFAEKEIDRFWRDVEAYKE